MPLYEYACKSCGHADTLLEKIDAKRVKKCPECGKARAFRRVVSSSSFQLKGSGWYQTDFRDRKPRSPASVPERPSPKVGEGSGSSQ